MPSVIAVDLGGTKLSAALVDAAGEVSHRVKIPVTSGDIRATVDQVARVVEEVLHASGISRERVRAIGVIVPGIYFASTGEAWAPNLWGHANVPLRAELERELRIPVKIDSDRAGCVTGERWLGAARGSNDVVFLAVGTGIGAGIISGGRLVRGAADISGAVGWFALNPQWREVYRDTGCWEAEAAGPALARRLGASSAEDVVARARHGEAAATQAMEQAAMYLGMGIANIVSILNPEIIVLGGGLMQAADLFLEPIRRTVAQWAQPVAAKQVRIEMTQLGEDAGLLGAARLALGDSRAD
jgi:glucokinase